MPDDSAEPIDPAIVARAALETLVFAPIGLGAKLVDDAPSAIRRVRQELSNARFIGRLTVEQGTARFRERPAPDNPAPSVGADDPVTSPGNALGIEGYDELPAIEIVALLETLTSGQRDAIAEHEAAHRRRRTVLGKIAQLAE